MGGTGKMGMEGYAPIVRVVSGNPEAQKYGEMWKHAEYRVVSPGEQLAQLFLQQARPKLGSEVLDLGCGTGRGGFMLAMAPPVGASMRVTLVDFVRNCLDDDIRQMLETQKQSLRFVKADLEQPLPVAAQYGFCCDVMEHIPTAKVGAVLLNILSSAQHVFFSISNVDDSCGKLIGAPLHLTVRPFAWWLQLFQQLNCVVHYSADMGGTSVFYVSNWVKGEEVRDGGVLNVEQELVRKNVSINTKQPWAQVVPHQVNDWETIILGGGPSMREQLPLIKRMRADGAKLVTLNGSYNFALANDLVPSIQIVVDAREFNKRFTRPVTGATKYLIASQCDPAVFDGLPTDRTWIWHTSAEHIRPELDAAYGEGVYYSVPGGSTVLLRALPLLRMLGFKKFHLFGCDSCLSAGEVHHAYSQPENDAAPIVATTTPDGRVFQCHPWMISQAQEMQDLIRMLGDEMELEIYGDGLLAHLLKLAADGDMMTPLAQPTPKAFETD